MAIKKNNNINQTHLKAKDANKEQTKIQKLIKKYIHL